MKLIFDMVIIHIYIYWVGKQILVENMRKIVRQSNFKLAIGYHDFHI